MSESSVELNSEVFVLWSELAQRWEKTVDGEVKEGGP